MQARWWKTFFLVFQISTKSLWLRKSFWVANLIFAFCLLILFPFAFGIAIIKQPAVQIGCLWSILEFVSVLTIGQMYTAEQEAHALDLLLSSQNPRSAILMAKIIFTGLLIFSLEVPIHIFWMIFFNVSPLSFFSFTGNLTLISLFFAFGSSSLGALIYSLTSRSQAKEILQPILFFPLQTAILLASVNVSLSLESLQNLSAALSNQAWWTILMMYPVLFSAIGWILSSYLFEE